MGNGLLPYGVYSPVGKTNETKNFKYEWEGKGGKDRLGAENAGTYLNQKNQGKPARSRVFLLLSQFVS